MRITWAAAVAGFAVSFVVSAAEEKPKPNEMSQSQVVQVQNQSELRHVINSRRPVSSDR